ncbi:hypothetical protein A1O1_02840 [Capronia coronata CBS 617.96]|uniref:Utp8 beta-propeller domain-containing protein n=1 Tax=Capronia coronata CBS 617.96 TaxID=1182541 RepID=W9ZIX8_9EURO|nr:uncharacterized protein A1O1_02840 [Capronia coronata CBS 617.96]EXJ94444.1 hypothetical protein A1O1_02840 [Capronia coronata CBS 617.96]
MEITAPHLLAKLPRTTKPETAVSFGSVYALRDGLKKRRKEICVAVDGDSLNLYEVQDGKILASYPVPPSSSFSGPPCSIRSNSGEQPYRTTYCTIKRGDLRVQSFHTSEGQLHDTKTATSPNLRDQRSPTVYLDYIPNQAGGRVLIAQQNGALTIFSSDLHSTMLDQTLSLPDAREIHVLAAQHLTSLEAQKTILKQRPDLAAEATQSTSYLAVAYERGNDKKVTYGIFSLGDTGHETVSSEISLHTLFEHELSIGIHEPSSVAAKEKMCQFSPSASHLYIGWGASFFCYDLSRLIPVEVARLHTGATGSHQVMAISPAFAICSSQDSFRLYDLKYQSIQASIDTRNTNLKRKRMRMASEFQSGPVEFVAFFANSSRIIGRRGHQLLAIDVSLNGHSKRMLHVGSNLLHNIGRGIGDQDTAPASKSLLEGLAIGTQEAKAVPDTQWQHTRKRLDQLAQTGDVAGFEDTFVESVRRDFLNSTAQLKMVDGLPSSGIAISHSKINYLLSKLFQSVADVSDQGDISTGATKSLKVQIPSFRLLIWLSNLGLLSIRSIQRAGADFAGLDESLAVNAVVRALLAVDPDKGLLVECLEGGFSPYVEEQAAIVQVLVDQALALFSGADLPSKDRVPAETELGEGFNLAADLQVQKSSASKPNGTWLPSQLHRALVLALDRFGTAATSRILKCLRDMFTQTEVLAVIQILRQQLFQGGHTRSYQSQSNAGIEETERASTVKLDAVIRLLSSCIDAIGPLGFHGDIDHADHADFVGNIVPDLVTEITHAQQSLEDVTDLQGIVREALRYQESLQKYRDAGARLPNDRRRGGTEQSAGTIVTLYSETTEGRDGLRNGDGLPLSMRAERVIIPLKIRKGGGQVSKRSAREMNMLERKQKGQYSFERLVL